MRIRRKKTILEQAADYVEAAVETALEKAGPVLTDAREKAAPMLADAKLRAESALEQAGPTLIDARDKAAPLLAQSAALAAEKAALAADIAAQKAAHGRDLAAAKAAELSTTPKQNKKHWFRRLLVITGIAALLGFAVNKMRSAADDEENWQSSYTPTPPAPAATDTPIADAASVASVPNEGADEGGAGPDEALADAVEEQHEVTTPDEPADVVEVDTGEKPAAKKSAKS